MHGKLHSVSHNPLQLKWKNADLRVAALLHPSRKRRGDISGFERLEFLGDRVLGLIIAEWLYELFPQDSEGALAKRHAQLVRAETLIAVAEGWDIASAIEVAGSEKLDGVLQSTSLLADAAEALLAAVYLDQGYAAVRNVVRNAWAPFVDGRAPPPNDPKSALQEWSQGRGLPVPNYEVVGQTGPDHAPSFIVRVSLPGYPPVEGQGASKRLAEKDGAIKLLSILAR